MALIAVCICILSLSFSSFGAISGRLKNEDILTSNYLLYKDLQKGVLPQLPLNVLRIRDIVHDISQILAMPENVKDASYVASLKRLIRFESSNHGSVMERREEWIAELNVLLDSCEGRRKLEIEVDLHFSKNSVALELFFKIIEEYVSANLNLLELSSALLFIIDKETIPYRKGQRAARLSCLSGVTENLQSFFDIIRSTKHAVFDELKSWPEYNLKFFNTEQKSVENVKLNQQPAYQIQLWLNSALDYSKEPKNVIKSYLLVFFKIKKWLISNADALSINISPFKDYTLFDALSQVKPVLPISKNLKFEDMKLLFTSLCLQISMKIDLFKNADFAKIYYAALSYSEETKPIYTENPKFVLETALHPVDNVIGPFDRMHYLQISQNIFNNPPISIKEPSPEVYSFVSLFFFFFKFLNFLDGKMFDATALGSEIEYLLSRALFLLKDFPRMPKYCFHVVDSLMHFKKLTFADFKLHFEHLKLLICKEEKAIKTLELFSSINYGLELILSIAYVYYAWLKTYKSIPSFRLEDSYMAIADTMHSSSSEFDFESSAFKWLNLASKNQHLNSEWSFKSDFDDLSTSSSAPDVQGYKISNLVGFDELCSKPLKFSLFKVCFSHNFSFTSRSKKIMNLLCRLHSSKKSRYFLFDLDWVRIKELLVNIPHTESDGAFVFKLGNRQFSYFSSMGNLIPVHKMIELREFLSDLFSDSALKVYLYSQNDSPMFDFEPEKRLLKSVENKVVLYHCFDNIEVFPYDDQTKILFRYFLSMVFLMEFPSTSKSTFKHGWKTSMKESFRELTCYTMLCSNMLGESLQFETDELMILEEDSCFLAHLYVYHSKQENVFPVPFDSFEFPFFVMKAVFPPVLSPIKRPLIDDDCTFVAIQDLIEDLSEGSHPEVVQELNSLSFKSRNDNEAFVKGAVSLFVKYRRILHLMILEHFTEDQLLYLIRFLPILQCHNMPCRRNVQRKICYWKKAMKLLNFDEETRDNLNFYANATFLPLLYVCVDKVKAGGDGYSGYSSIEDIIKSEIAQQTDRLVSRQFEQKVGLLSSLLVSKTKDRKQSSAVGSLKKGNSCRETDFFWQQSHNSVLLITGKNYDFSGFHDSLKACFEKDSVVLFGPLYHSLLESYKFDEFKLEGLSIILARYGDQWKGTIDFINSFLQSIKKLYQGLKCAKLRQSLKAPIATIEAVFVKATKLFFSAYKTKTLSVEFMSEYISLFIEISALSFNLKSNLATYCTNNGINWNDSDVSSCTDEFARFLHAIIEVLERIIRNFKEVHEHPKILSDLTAEYVQFIHQNVRRDEHGMILFPVAASAISQDIFSKLKICISYQPISINVFDHYSVNLFSFPREVFPIAEGSVSLETLFSTLLVNAKSGKNFVPKDRKTAKILHIFVNILLTIEKAVLMERRIKEDELLSLFLFLVQSFDGAHLEAISRLSDLNLSKNVVSCAKYLNLVPKKLLSVHDGTVNEFLSSSLLLISALYTESIADKHRKELELLFFYNSILYQLNILKLLLKVGSPSLANLTAKTIVFKNALSRLNESKYLADKFLNSFVPSISVECKIKSTEFEAKKMDENRREFKSSSIPNGSHVKLLDICRLFDVQMDSEILIQINDSWYNLEFSTIKSLCKILYSEAPLVVYRDLQEASCFLDNWNHIELPQTYFHTLKWTSSCYSASSKERAVQLCEKTLLHQFTYESSSPYFIVPSYKLNEFKSLLLASGIDDSTNLAFNSKTESSFPDHKFEFKIDSSFDYAKFSASPFNCDLFLDLVSARDAFPDYRAILGNFITANSKSCIDRLNENMKFDNLLLNLQKAEIEMVEITSRFQLLDLDDLCRTRLFMISLELLFVIQLAEKSEDHAEKRITFIIALLSFSQRRLAYILDALNIQKREEGFTESIQKIMKIIYDQSKIIPLLVHIELQMLIAVSAWADEIVCLVQKSAPGYEKCLLSSAQQTFDYQFNQKYPELHNLKAFAESIASKASFSLSSFNYVSDEVFLNSFKLESKNVEFASLDLEEYVLKKSFFYQQSLKEIKRLNSCKFDSILKNETLDKIFLFFEALSELEDQSINFLCLIQALEEMMELILEQLKALNLPVIVELNRIIEILESPLLNPENVNSFKTFLKFYFIALQQSEIPLVDEIELLLYLAFDIRQVFLIKKTVAKQWAFKNSPDTCFKDYVKKLLCSVTCSQKEMVAMLSNIKMSSFHNSDKIRTVKAKEGETYLKAICSKPINSLSKFYLSILTKEIELDAESMISLCKFICFNGPIYVNDLLNIIDVIQARSFLSCDSDHWHSLEFEMSWSGNNNTISFISDVFKNGSNFLNFRFNLAEKIQIYRILRHFGVHENMAIQEK